MTQTYVYLRFRYFLLRRSQWYCEDLRPRQVKRGILENPFSIPSSYMTPSILWLGSLGEMDQILIVGRKVDGAIFMVLLAFFGVHYPTRNCCSIQRQHNSIKLQEQQGIRTRLTSPWDPKTLTESISEDST